MIEWMRIDVERVNWFSTYHVHHRVADRFRSGRAFLLGDAAHIHSPVGGQGMNTGIGDAVNLAWKLAAVLQRTRGRVAPRHLRAGAHRVRPAAGRDDRSGVHRRDELTGRSRGWCACTSCRWLLPLLFRSAAVRRLMFRTVSQTAIDYRGSA